jgi:hypothetical protein
MVTIPKHFVAKSSSDEVVAFLENQSALDFAKSKKQVTEVQETNIFKNLQEYQKYKQKENTLVKIQAIANNLSPEEKTLFLKVLSGQEVLNVKKEGTLIYDPDEIYEYAVKLTGNKFTAGRIRKLMQKSDCSTFYDLLQKFSRSELETKMGYSGVVFEAICKIVEKENIPWESINIPKIYPSASLTDDDIRAFLETGLEKFDFDIRTFNALKAGRFNNLKEYIIFFQKNGKPGFRNFGPKSQEQITKLLQQKGLNLKVNLKDYYPE